MMLKQRREWPKDATRLSGRLRRVVQSLRELGIAVETGTTGGTGDTRKIKISHAQPK